MTLPRGSKPPHTAMLHGGADTEVAVWACSARQSKGNHTCTNHACTSCTNHACTHALAVVQAIDAVIDARDGAAPPDSNEAWAAAIHAAALEGRLPISACLVLGVPLMREGPLRPVTLPCCHLAVSRAGAQRLMDKRWCQMCKSPWPTGGELRDNEPMTMAVALEASGFLPRIFRQAEVTIHPDADTNRNNPSGREGDGKEVKGTVQGGVVAVKQIPLPTHAERVGMVGVKQVIASAFAAALRSLYVRRVHGYCLAGSEIWCDMSSAINTIKNC